MQSLIELYFVNVNLFMPLLHRPTFDAGVTSGLYMENEGFASLLLMVCACGAKFSTDARVLSEGTDNWHSAGWKYFAQVQNARRLVNLRLPRLYDIQIPCVRMFHSRSRVRVLISRTIAADTFLPVWIMRLASFVGGSWPWT